MTTLTRPAPGFLRYKIDRVSIGLVVTAVIIQLGLYLLFVRSWWELLLLIPLLEFLRPLDLIEHNVAHVRIFHRHEGLEEMLELLLVFGTAMPMELYRVQHVQTHHHYTNRPDDWSGPFSYKGTVFPTKPSRVRYALCFYPRAWYRGSKIMCGPHKNTPAYDRFVRSLAVLAVSWAALAYFNWRAWLLFYVTPWMIANVAKVRANWKHHVHCDFATPQTSANVNLSLFAMTLGFFVGLHSTHHAEPTLHWSLLPQHWHSGLQSVTSVDHIRRGWRHP